MTCAQCGAMLATGSRFCGNCGAPVPQERMPVPRAIAAAPAKGMDRTVIDDSLAAWLVIVQGGGEGLEYPIKDTVRIGRAVDNDIVLEDSQASRHHAAIVQEAAGYSLQDLNSSNGTFLNERRVAEPRMLRDGDLIRMGKTILLFRWGPPSKQALPAPRYETSATMVGRVPSEPIAGTARTQVPQVPAVETPGPQVPGMPVGGAARSQVERKKPTGGLPVGPLALGVGLVVLACVVAAIAIYFLRGGPEGELPSLGADRATAPLVTQVVTNTPPPVMTVVVTSEPEPTATPTITPTPGPLTVRVAPDGSGDYTGLEEAVDAALAGSTIVLDPGTHRLTGSLEFRKSLTLRGAGLDQTFVVGTEGEPMVLFNGPGLFAAQDITFRYEGTAWASVLSVESGEIEIARCRFTGAVWSEAEEKGGDGLVLWGDTTGTVRECQFEGNQLHGIEIRDQAQPTLEGNTSMNNEQNGIMYWDESGGVARQNNCSGNKLHGIGVSEQSQPTLEGNICLDNQQVGIRYSGSSAGVARSNDCSGNGLHGIVISEQSRPTLEANICQNNQQVGIRYSGSGGGMARQNQCSGNGLSGIVVLELAQPTLEGNVCNDNAGSGIVYFGDAGGTAVQNTCSGNDLDGISVFEQAQPTLEGNVCQDNQGAGIRYAGGSGGVARQNECSGNRWGIQIGGTADPDLQDNSCQSNTEADTVLFTDDFNDESGGWWTGVDDGGEARYQDGELRIRDYTEPKPATVTRPGRQFTDLILEVESRLVGGTENNWHGVYCRYNDGDNYYVAAFSADGYYTGLAVVGGETTEWVKERSAAIRQGSEVTNEVRLACVGSSIRFWVNDTLLIDVTDTRLLEGDIALDAESEDGDYTEIAFDNLIVLAP
jgi:parallel beta-helix repeat protein